MRTLPDRRVADAHTVSELAVTTAVAVLVGMVLMAALGRALDLYSRDAGQSLAQEEGRAAAARIEARIREAASLPLLLDASGTPWPGAGPAPGFRIARVVGGPFPVHNNAQAGSVHLRLRTGNFTPRVGDSVLIPTHGVERQIVKVAAEHATPTVRNLELDRPLGIDLTVVRAGTGNRSILASVTRSERVWVQENEIRAQPSARAGAPFDVLARNVESDRPFSMEHADGATVPVLRMQFDFAPSSGIRSRTHRRVVTIHGAAAPRDPKKEVP